MDHHLFKQWIVSDTCQTTFKKLYGPDKVSKQQKRYMAMADRFLDLFSDVGSYEIFSAPGRIEVCGNHTDHQLGRVLTMAVDLDMVAFARSNDDKIIRVHSKDHESAIVSLEDLSIQKEEYFTTKGLVRGLAHYYQQINGVVGGVDVYVESEVASGSGLSSSAAIEVLILTILDHFYHTKAISNTQIGIMAQQAENYYFNKPCGLMDQLIIAHGGCCAIDFYDKKHPTIDKTFLDSIFDAMDICLVQCGGSHADLSNDYAEIFEDCKKLANFFGQDYLSRVSEDDFYRSLPQLHKVMDTRVLLRGYHFIKENQRVLDVLEAIKTNNMQTFLKHIIESGYSSFHYLQNVLNKHDLKQGLALGLMMAESHLQNKGAWRVHGGGFAGTILLFVPKEITKTIKTDYQRVFGPDCFVIVRQRTEGALCISV